MYGWTVGSNRAPMSALYKSFIGIQFHRSQNIKYLNIFDVRMILQDILTHREFNKIDIYINISLLIFLVYLTVCFY